MALIIPHESNVAIGSAQAGQSAQYQNPSSFISNGQRTMMRGMQELSNGANTLGNAILEDTIKKQKEQTEIDVLKDMQDLQANSSAWQDTYMQAHNGVEARNAEEDTKAFLKENLSPLLEKWKDNPTAYKYILSNGGLLANSLRSAARNHASKQEQLYQNGVMRVERATTENILNDPNISLEEREKAWGSYVSKRMAYGTRQGEPLEAIQQDLDVLQKNTNFTRLSLQAQSDPQEVMRILEGQPRSAQLPKDITVMAKRIAKENKISPELILSIIATESAGNATAKSQKGAYGLMQLMPDTQKELEKKYGIDGSTPEGNIKLGTLYVKELLQKYKGDQVHALMAYNWGMGNVDSFLNNGHGKKIESNPSGQIPLETKSYVSKVLGKDDENIKNSLSPIQRVKLTTVAEVAFADSKADALYNEVHVKDMTESEAIKKINAIDNKKVRQATLQGLTERLRVDKVKEREDIETASIKAYEDASSILGSNSSDAKILSGLHTLMKDAEKKALTGTKADKASFEVIQKIYMQASTPLGISKNSDPKEFLTAQKEIMYGSITTEKDLKIAHPTLASKDIDRLSSVLASSQKVNLAEINRVITLFEGDSPPLTGDDKKLFHALIIQNIIDASKESNAGNNPEWIKQFVAQYFIDRRTWWGDSYPKALVKNEQFYPKITNEEAKEIKAEFKENPELEKTYQKNHGEMYAVRARFLDKMKEQAKRNEPKRPDDVSDSAVWDKKRLGWVDVHPATGKKKFRPLGEDDI